MSLELFLYYLVLEILVFVTPVWSAILKTLSVKRETTLTCKITHIIINTVIALEIKKNWARFHNHNLGCVNVLVLTGPCLDRWRETTVESIQAIYIVHKYVFAVNRLKLSYELQFTSKHS